MAEVKMDLSEYQVLMENKRLLENSLEKERDLQEQIKKLTDEKTHALENAQMKVTKITRSERKDYLYKKKLDQHIWVNLWSLLGLDYRTLPKMPQDIHIDHLIGAFFDQITSISCPTVEVTTHGLDEIKAEIRTQLWDEMDEDTQRKIKDAESILYRNNELLKENNTLTQANERLNQLNSELLIMCNKATQYTSEVENNARIINYLRNLLKDGYTLWNRSKLLNSIMKTLMVITVTNKT